MVSENGREQAQRLARRARVNVTWVKAPEAASVQEALEERLLEGLVAPNEADQDTHLQ